VGCTSNPTILMPSVSKNRNGRSTRGNPPCSKRESAFRLRSALSATLLFCLSIVTSAQTPSQPHPFATRKADQPKRENTTPQQIPLTVPAGTPIRVALSERVRIARQGTPLTGKVTDTIYAFDQPVIPAGSEVRGQVTQVAPIPKMRRIMAIANADFSPPHEYSVTFDKLILNDGKISRCRRLPLQALRKSSILLAPPRNPERRTQQETGPNARSRPSATSSAMRKLRLTLLDASIAPSNFCLRNCLSPTVPRRRYALRRRSNGSSGFWSDHAITGTVELSGKRNNAGQHVARKVRRRS